MAINLAEYAYKLTLDSSEYTRNMQEAETQANGMKSKLSGVGDFLKASLTTGLLAAGAAIGATIVSGVKATAELDQQMSQFRATTGATAEEAEKIRALSQELFKTNTDSMEDIVATATEMTKTMGMTTDEVEKYQQKYLYYAKTTSQSNVDVIKAIDDIGDAWGLTAEESSKSLDMLKASSQEFGTDISSVQSTLSSVAPAAKALGLSLEETNGYMNLFAASGLDASAATTAFTYAAKTVKSPEEFRKMLTDIQA
ncbi:MAG: phage tail tape measure protein, partial [Bacillota bacterium]